MKTERKKLITFFSTLLIFACSFVNVYASSYSADFSITGGVFVKQHVSNTTNVSVTTRASCEVIDARYFNFDVILQQHHWYGWSSGTYYEHPFNGSKTSKFSGLSKDGTYRVYIREYAGVRVDGSVYLDW